VSQVLKGSISGTVADPQGAVVSGAQVKTTNIAHGKRVTTTSDSSGLFRFNLIVAGDYKIEVSAPHSPPRCKATFWWQRPREFPGHHQTHGGRNQHQRWKSQRCSAH